MTTCDHTVADLFWINRHTTIRGHTQSFQAVKRVDEFSFWLARGLICCLDKRVVPNDRTTSCRTPDFVFHSSIFSDVYEMLNE